MNNLPFFNYSVNNNADAKDTIDLYIDGEIVQAETEQMYRDWYNDDTKTSFKGIREQIEKGNPEVVNIYINSGGGQVIEAMAIHDYIVSLENRGVIVNTIGRGIIASAATYILMSSKNSTISENSWFMIHNVSGFAYGDVNEVERQSKTLRKFNDTIVEFYARETGMNTDEINDMMNAETWLTGQDAFDKNFVKNVEKKQEFNNEISGEKWLFNNKEVLLAYNSFTPKNNNKMNTEDVTKAITNGFEKLLTAMNIKKSDVPAEAIVNFSKSITDAVDSASKISDADLNERINNMIVANTTPPAPPAPAGEEGKDVTPPAPTNTVSEQDIADMKAKIEDLTQALIKNVGGSNPDTTAKKSRYDVPGVSMS